MNVNQVAGALALLSAGGFRLTIRNVNGQNGDVTVLAEHVLD